MNLNRFFPSGPAVLVAAAFIGPGTVLTASVAGAEYGMALLWVVVFAVVATTALQEMAARLGIVTGSGLAQAITESTTSNFLRWAILLLVLAAIFVGNAAYQTGNLLGAAAGATILVGLDQSVPAINSFVALTAVSALLVIWFGRLKWLQRTMMGLIGLMSLVFVVSAFRSAPAVMDLGSGLLPTLPVGSEWFVVGLIGTTIVPYNLFLHASAASEQWGGDSVDQTNDAVRQSRMDTIFAVSLGGLITMAILITAACVYSSGAGDEAVKFSKPTDVVRQLRPALGDWAGRIFAVGLFAAGFTSSITAPVAAGYAAAGCFGWPNELSDWRLKTVSSVVVLFGGVFAVLAGTSPTQVIVLAQVANGMLLPVVAVVLLVLLNRSKLMGEHRNGVFSNVLGFLVVAVVTVIGYKNLAAAFEKIFG